MTLPYWILKLFWSISEGVPVYVDVIKNKKTFIKELKRLLAHGSSLVSIKLFYFVHEHVGEEIR